MSTMADNYLFTDTSGLNPSETEIRHVFKHLVTTLCNQKWKIVDQITDWSKIVMRQVQDHVNDQRKLLDQIYDQKVSCLDTIRDQFLKQALTYEQQNEQEQMNQLINQCNSLKFQLAMLVYTERPIVSIQLLTEEQLLQTNRDQCVEHKIEHEQSQTTLTENHDNDIIHNSDTNANSTPEVSLVNTESLNELFPITQSINYEDQSLMSNYELRNSITQHNILIEKCPICYMIFPKAMTVCDRNLHINEHYKDD